MSRNFLVRFIFNILKTDYHNAVNFRPEIEPEFMSTRNAFFVTLYNLNYDVPVTEIGLLIDN